MSNIGRFNPRRVSGATLRGAIRPSRRLDILSTPRTTGAAPPAVTFSGDLVLSRDVRLECTTGGTRSASVWRYTLNGGSSYVTGVPGAATIALTPSGVIANLPNSTYAGDEVYRGIVSTVTGPYGTVWDGVTGAETTTPHVGYINGRPAIHTVPGAGTRVLRSNTQTLADAIVMGDDLDFTIAGVFQYNDSLSPTNQRTILSFCNGSSGAAGFFLFAVSPAGAWRCSKRGDTGGTTIVDGGTADTNPHYFVITHTGTAVSLRIDGVAVFTAQAQNVSAIAAGSGAIYLGYSSVQGVPPNDFPADVKIGDLYFWNNVLSATDIAIVERSLKNDWGL